MGRISGSRGRGFSGSGFKGRSFKSGGFRSSGFKPSGTRHYGGYSHRYRPYRRNYIFHSLGPVGKVIYIVGIIILFLVLSFI